MSLAELREGMASLKHQKIKSWKNKRQEQSLSTKILQSTKSISKEKSKYQSERKNSSIIRRKFSLTKSVRCKENQTLEVQTHILLIKLS